MIVETVVNLLKETAEVAGIVADRIFPDELPEATTFPAIVVSKGAGVGNYTLEGDDGLEDGRISVDMYGINYAIVIDLRLAVRRKLSGFRGGLVSGNPCAIQGAFCINDSDLSESSTERAGPRLRRRNLEFRIWNREI